MQIRGKTIPTLWLGGAAVVALLVLIGLVAWQSGPVLGQSFTIGYVDMQRALDNHPRKASSERALQEFFQAKQREFQQRVKSLGPVQRQELDRQLQQEFVQKREELLSGLGTAPRPPRARGRGGWGCLGLGGGAPRAPGGGGVRCGGEGGGGRAGAPRPAPGGAGRA